MPAISVIIATYNRAQSLKDTLDSLLRQEPVRGSFYEIIVVDNNSTDETKIVIESFKRKLNGQLKYLFEERQGKSYALNTGIQAAGGDILAFTDDDVIIDNRWLANIQKSFANFGLDCVGGRVLPLFADTTPSWLKDNAPYLRGPIVSYDYGEDAKAYDEREMDPFIGANMAIRRELVKEIGYFHTDLGPGKGRMGDDTEFFSRMVRARKRIFYCGSAVMWHKVENERMRLSYFARWNIAHGRHAALEEFSKQENNLVLYLGIPRYLMARAIKRSAQFFKNVFNKNLSLRHWCGFFFDIGMMFEYHFLSKKKKGSGETIKTTLSVCFLCRPFHQNRGGTETYVYQMAKALAKEGHLVHIVAVSGEDRFYCEDLGERVKIHKIDFRADPFRGSWRLEKFFPLYAVRYSRAVSKMINKISRIYPIDVVESPDWSIEAFWYARKRRKIPVCVRLHGHPDYKQRDNGNMRRNMKYRLIWHMQRNLIFNADLVTAVSDDFKDLTSEVLRLGDLTIPVIRNGTDTALFKPNAHAAEGISVLFAGRLEEDKGIGILSKAIPAILNKFPRVKFYFAGKNCKRPNTPETWQEYLERRIPNDSLVFLGQLPTTELIKYFQRCAVGVFPSLYEPGGTVAIEAMACGCAVIASRVGGFSETIKDRENGLLIPPNDPDALAKAVCEVLTDTELRKKISHNAIIHIQKNYTVENTVEQTLLLYRKTIEAHTSGMSL